MSGHGGSRAGSGRKRLYSSKNSYNEIWRRGHRRIWIDNIIYSSWVSTKLKCGYSSDSNFAAHELRTTIAAVTSTPVQPFFVSATWYCFFGCTCAGRDIAPLNRAITEKLRGREVTTRNTVGSLT